MIWSTTRQNIYRYQVFFRVLCFVRHEPCSPLENLFLNSMLIASLKYQITNKFQVIATKYQSIYGKSTQSIWKNETLLLQDRRER